MISVEIGQTVPLYFIVETTDGNPALGEAGALPENVINSGSWTTNGISPLVSLGYGRYTSTLDLSLLSVTDGDIIQLRYKGPTTKESKGETLIIGTLLQDPISVSNYGSVNDADLFFSGMVNTQAWDSASTVDRLKSLKQATRIIDRLNFAGEKTDENQVLQFPRDASTSVPDDIKIACYHIAIMLLDDYDQEIESEKLMTNMNKYQSVQSYYDRSFIPEYKVAGIPSAIAWGYLKPYLRDSRELTLVRS